MRWILVGRKLEAKLLGRDDPKIVAALDLKNRCSTRSQRYDQNRNPLQLQSHPLCNARQCHLPGLKSSRRTSPPFTVMLDNVVRQLFKIYVGVYVHLPKMDLQFQQEPNT
ncbi:hypothetical protein NE237_002598 [Protea cynaroides]|uniref:Uncharacterized protein n=1 Tax=Protea cynaroides TaxID=273540 RepID=A0A9Q0KVJ8_9MAGN|nr:hypothetical protein NE237_002598 [Protea cynaroides]